MKREVSLDGNLKIFIIGMVLTLIVSALVGLFLFSEKFSTLLFLILASAFSILGLLLLSPNRERIFFSLQITFLYLAIMAGFLGPAFLSINVGPFHLFPYRVLLITLWLLFIVNFLLSKGSIRVRHLKVKNFLNFLLFWFVYAVLSLVWAVDKGAALREVIFLFVNISIVFFIVFYLSELNLLKKLYFLWLMIFAIFIPVAFFEVFTGQHLSVSKLASTIHPRLAFLPTTFFYNPNDFATYLVLSLPFILTLIRYNRKILARLIGGLAFFSGVFLLFSTRSRANLFAFLVGLTFWYLFLLEKKAKLNIAVITLLIVALFFGLAPSKAKYFVETVRSQYESIIYDLTSKDPSTFSVDIRINLLKNAVVFFKNSYGFGVGAGNSEYYLSHFQTYNTYGVVQLHNWWLEIFTNYGVFIFVGYILFYLSLLWGLYKSFLSSKDHQRIFCEALLIGLVSFFFAAMSSSTILSFKPQWFYFAFALAFLNYWRRSEEVKT